MKGLRDDYFTLADHTADYKVTFAFRRAALNVETANGIAGVVLRGLRLQVIAQAIYGFGSFLKGKRGLIVGSVDAHYQLAQFTHPDIAGA